MYSYNIRLLGNGLIFFILFNYYTYFIFSYIFFYKKYKTKIKISNGFPVYIFSAPFKHKDIKGAMTRIVDHFIIFSALENTCCRF